MEQYNNKDLMNREIKVDKRLHEYIETLHADEEPKNTFSKFDDGKPMVSLIETKFILGIAEILTEGASKYGIGNWKNATRDDIPRLKDALLRHTLAYTSGELLDGDSHKSHAFHAACNLMFLDYLLNLKVNK